MEALIILTVVMILWVIVFLWNNKRQARIAEERRAAELLAEQQRVARQQWLDWYKRYGTPEQKLSIQQLEQAEKFHAELQRLRSLQGAHFLWDIFMD